MHNIVMCGVPRSGSTLVWQILQAVFPGQKIPKTHPGMWEANESIVVVSIRNPYDITASLLRVRLNREGRKKPNWRDIKTVLRRNAQSFNCLKDVLLGPHAPILRYEDFYNDYSLIYIMIERMFDVVVSFRDRKKINGRFSLARNRSRAGALKDFNEIDKDQIHGNHIGHVTPGYWVTYLPDWSMERVKEVCAPLCKEWGYNE